MRLEITRKANLAIRTLATLQREGGRLSGRELAARIGTTRPFLAQVVTPLARMNWVASQPGRSGGYEVTPEAAEATVLDIIEAVEGPTDIETCVLREGECSAAAPCATHEAWSRARHALLSELAATPLADLSPSGERR